MEDAAKKFISILKAAGVIEKKIVMYVYLKKNMIVIVGIGWVVILE